MTAPEHLAIAARFPGGIDPSPTSKNTALDSWLNQGLLLFLLLQLCAGFFDDLPLHKMLLFAVDDLVILVTFTCKQNDVAGLCHLYGRIDRLAAVGDAGVGGI